MTEIEKRADDFFGNEMPSPSTRRVYRMNYRRFQTRVPAYAWGDVETVLRYRSLLTPALRGPFGVMFSRLYDKCMEWGVPCVPPDTFRKQIEVPCLVVKHIDTLAMFSNYPDLTTLNWGDISEQNGAFYLRGSLMNDLVIAAITAIGEYYWPNQTPPPDAPMIALSPATARHRLHPEMAEQIVARTATLSGYLEESEYAFQMYPYMFKYGMSIGEMRRVLDSLEKVSRLPDFLRRKARRTLREAQGSLSWGNLPEFRRLLQVAEEGRQAHRSKKLEDSLSDLSPRKSLLPSKAPGLSLSDDLG